MATTKPIPAQMQLTTPGKTLGDWDSIRNAVLNMNSGTSTYAITALGTNQATATAISSVYNQVDTAASGTGVNLPLSTGRRNTAFQYCVIVNNGANSIQVYGFKSSTDTINGVAGSTGIPLTAGTTTIFISVKGGAWFANSSLTMIPSAVRGTFTATGATEVVVSNVNITANSVVVFGLKTAAGTIAGAPYMSSVTAGTSFGVKAGASDTSVYNYAILG